MKNTLTICGQNPYPFCCRKQSQMVPRVGFGAKYFRWEQLTAVLRVLSEYGQYFGIIYCEYSQYFEVSYYSTAYSLLSELQLLRGSISRVLPFFTRGPVVT